MQRSRVLLIFSLPLALPAFARVLPHGLYTSSRYAAPAFQERTTRHFVLVEETSEETEVVLYDSRGAEDPRVLAPKGDLHYTHAALFQKPGHRPQILIAGALPWATSPHVFITDTAGTRRLVTGLERLENASLPYPDDIDTGGFFTHGLSAPIVIGNEAWPFIVNIGLANGPGSVWAISTAGEAKEIFRGAGARVIGRNAAGDRFLIYADRAVWVTGVAGPAARLVNVDPSASYGGWITASGSVYLQKLGRQERLLFLIRGGALQFIAAPFLAVPTHDYGGAWIIHGGEATTLSRHTVAGGLQIMWSDAAAPRVEALIAGASGETLLVQIHDRRTTFDSPSSFFVPAFAVWRIGEPPPRAFHRFRLHEDPARGFVHVDVDAIADGEPFVFNSGFQEIWRGALHGVAREVQERGVVRASLRQVLIAPGVARTAGAFGSFWTTDVTLSNPLEERQEVEIRFAPHGVDASSPSASSITLTLDPLESRVVPDVLHALFGLETAGGTMMFVPADRIDAIARTYSRSGNGTAGFAMRAVDVVEASAPRVRLSFPGAFAGERFRTNFVLTDTSGRGARATLHSAAFRSSAQALVASVEAPAGGAAQRNALALQGGLLVAPTHGAAIATVVAIDNITNDPTYVPPARPATGVQVIPIIGHAGGANGSRVRTDLYIESTDVLGEIWVEAVPWATGEKTAFRLFTGNGSSVYRDVLRTLFGMEGGARLRYWTTYGDRVRVTSRTYSVDADGGTVGCLVPPMNALDSARAGERLEIAGLAGGSAFRTNIGLVDLSGRAGANPRVRVSMLDERRRLIESFTTDVPARTGMHIDSVGPAAVIVIEVLSGQHVAAYATLTDEVTSDCSYFVAQPDL